MKYLIYGLFAVLCLSFVSAVNLAPGGNYSFSYVNASNQSDSEFFACFPPAVANLSATLSPGDVNVRLNSTYCDVSVSCASQTNSTPVCVIDTRLDPGEEFVRSNDVCDVRIDVREQDFSCSDVDTYTVERIVKLFRDGEFVSVEANGRTQDFFANASKWSYEYPVRFECPLNVTPDSLHDSDAILNTFSSFTPILAENYAQCLENNKLQDIKCDERMDRYFDANTNSSSQLVSCIRQVADLEKSTEDAVEDERIAKEALAACQSSALGSKVAAWFFGIIALVCGSGFAVFVIREVRSQ